MFMQIADRLTRFARLLPQALPDVRDDDIDERQSGWHESTWVMAQGLDVIELSAPVGATLFADTMASFYEPDEPQPLAA